jgi:hypothetical protein
VRYPGFAAFYDDEDARYALERAECIRRFVCERLGLDKETTPILEEEQ